MTIATYVLGALAIVIIIMGVAMMSYVAGRQRALQDLQQMLTKFIAPNNAPKNEDAPE